MNEAETRAEYIDPALKAAGWGVVEGSRLAAVWETAGNEIDTTDDAHDERRSKVSASRS
jgi:type I site-specific restriction endonuclease